MDTTTKVMLAGIATTLVAPALAAALGAAPALLKKSTDRRPLVAGVASLLAVVTGLLAVRGLPSGIPTDSIDWIPMVVAVAGLALLVPDAMRFGSRWLAGTAIFGTVIAVGGYLVLRPVLDSGATAPLALGLGIVLSTVVFAATTRREAPGESSAALFAALGMSTGGAALVVAASGSALVGQMLGAAATGAGVLTVLAWIRPSLAPSRATFGVFLGAISLLGAYAYAFSELHPAATAALLVAPLGALAAAAAAAKWKRAAASLGAATVPVAIALGIALMTQGAPADDGGDDYGYPSDEAETDGGSEGYYTPY